MHRKIIAMLTMIALLVTMAGTMAVFGDNDAEDTFGLGVVINGTRSYNDSWTGAYSVGTEKEFTTTIWSGGSRHENIRRELKVYGTGAISNFEFYSNGAWVPVATYNKQIIANVKDENSKKRKFHITFEKEGRYVIEFNLYDANGKLLTADRYDMEITDAGIAGEVVKSVPDNLPELISSYDNIVTLDGSDIAVNGDTYILPVKGQDGYSEKGYAIAGKNYKPGEEITVNGRVTATSIRTDVIMDTRTSIRLVSPSGIRFRADVTGKIPEGVETGMKIATEDRPDRTVEIMNSGNETNFVGALVNIHSDNYARSFYVRGYVKVSYADGDVVTYVNNGAYALKSVKEAAESILNNTEYFNSLSSEQQTLINTFAK